MLENVIWGNQDVIDLRLKGTGDTQELTVWFSREIQSDSESAHD